MSPKSKASWTIKEMDAEEVDCIREIDVSESGDVVYKWLGGRVEPVSERWRRPRSYGDGWLRRAEGIRDKLAQGGIALGAFDRNRLIGFACLRYKLADDVAELGAMWVSRRHRRQGVATALVRQLLRRAKQSGAKSVYVSATPSESAQRFYRGQGFRPTVFVHMVLYAKEPEDIHMIRDL